MADEEKNGSLLTEREMQEMITKKT